MFKLAIDFIENCKVSSNKREIVEIKGYFLAFIDAGCLGKVPGPRRLPAAIMFMY